MLVTISGKLKAKKIRTGLFKYVNANGHTQWEIAKVATILAVGYGHGYDDIIDGIKREGDKPSSWFAVNVGGNFDYEACTFSKTKQQAVDHIMFVESQM